MKSLSERRRDSIVKFCMQTKKHPIYSSWFANLSDQDHKTRRIKPLYKPVPFRTNKFTRSAIPAMSRLVSWHPPLIFKPPNVY